MPVPFLGDAAALVRGVRQNDLAAKAAFFERYVGRVERIITHVLGFDSELDDIVQEVFAAALASIDKLNDPSLLEPWLSRVAALTACKLLRGRTRRAWIRRFVDADEEERYEPVGALLDVEGRRALRALYALLDRLPADERVAFALRFIEGMGLDEIAATISVSRSTVRRRLVRAEQHFINHCRRYPELKPWVAGAARWQER